MMDDLQAFASQAAAISGQDQNTAAVVNVAADVAAYRARLLSAKIPRPLVDSLTMQCAGVLLQSLVGGCGCEDE